MHYAIGSPSQILLDNDRVTSQVTCFFICKMRRLEEERISQVPSCSEKFPQFLCRLQLPTGLLHVDVCHYLKLACQAEHITDLSISCTIPVKDSVHPPHHSDLESGYYFNAAEYLIRHQPPSTFFHISSLPAPHSSRPTILTCRVQFLHATC